MANRNIGYSNNGENTEDKNYTEEVQSQWLAFFSVVVVVFVVVARGRTEPLTRRMLAMLCDCTKQFDNTHRFLHIFSHFNKYEFQKRVSS